MNWKNYDIEVENEEREFIRAKLDELAKTEEEPKQIIGGILIDVPYGQRPDWDFD